jgi:predicted transcriptional regulator
VITLKVKITITLDKEVLEKIQQIAEKESRTVSSQINKIIKDIASDK